MLCCDVNLYHIICLSVQLFYLNPRNRNHKADPDEVIFDTATFHMNIGIVSSYLPLYAPLSNASVRACVHHRTKRVKVDFYYTRLLVLLLCFLNICVF